MSIRGRTPMSRSTTPDPMQKSFPTRTEWESWKDTIRELYIERNMTLSRLRDHMAQAHNFHAEDHEYKRRLSQWRFRKNYTSAEKEAAAKQLGSVRAQQQHLAEPSMQINNLPIRLDKIERHLKATRRQSSKTVDLQLSSDLDPSPEPDFALTMRNSSQFEMQQQMPSPQQQQHHHHHHHHQQQQQLMTTPTVPYAFPMDHTDAMMWNVNQFDQGRRDDMLGPSTPTQHQDRLDIVMLNIVKAVDVFGAGDSASAVRTLDEWYNSSYDIIHNVLQTDTWNFMLYMTVLQTSPVWNRPQCRNLYHDLYTYFARVSYPVLGQHHPVTEYLRTAVDFDHQEEALKRACYLVLELGAQQSAMAYTMVNPLGGIPANPNGGLEFCLLKSEWLRSASSRMHGSDRSALDRKVEEMVRLLRHWWYSLHRPAAADLMPKIKKSIEGCVRRAVVSLDAGVGAVAAIDNDTWRPASTSTSTPVNPQRYLSSTPDPAAMAMMGTNMPLARSFPPKGGR